MEAIKRLDDRYRLIRVIGQGSEGKVYLAIQDRTQKFLAVKEIAKNGACYSREGIEVWKRLSHRHLPQILDLIETEDVVWVVMEYVEGQTMTEWIRKYGYPSAAETFWWIYCCCDTLSYLHEQDPPVLFGDLKPENVMIQKGNPILIDLGSVYVKGSKGKRTGTYYALEAATKEDEKRDVMCLGKTIEEILPRKQSVFHLFARKAMGLEKHSFQQIKDGKRFLKRILFRGILQISMLVLGASILLLTGRSMFREQESEKVRSICEELNESLDLMLEDLVFAEEEYTQFLMMWGKVEQSERTYRDIVQDNLSEYARICYKVGRACWYFTDAWNGKKYADQWFAYLEALPAELQKKSSSYRKLEKWKEQVKLFADIPDTEGFFLRFYQEMKELTVSEQEEEPYFRIALYKEECLFLIHYLVQLKAEGMEETTVRMFLTEVKEYQSYIKDDRARVAVLTDEVTDLLQVLEEECAQIYGKDHTWETRKEPVQKEKKKKKREQGDLQES